MLKSAHAAAMALAERNPVSGRADHYGDPTYRDAPAAAAQ